MRISLSDAFLVTFLPGIGTLLSCGEVGSILTSLSLGWSSGTMRTPLSSLTGGAIRDLLEPSFGAGEMGPFEAGALLPASAAKPRSLPSNTRRTSLSLDALGGGDLLPLGLREPDPERDGFSLVAGCLPSGTSSLSSAPRL